jgi:hypothetical protein
MDAPRRKLESRWIYICFIPRVTGVNGVASGICLFSRQPRSPTNIINVLKVLNDLFCWLLFPQLSQIICRRLLKDVVRDEKKCCSLQRRNYIGYNIPRKCYERIPRNIWSRCVSKDQRTSHLHYIKENRSNPISIQFETAFRPITLTIMPIDGVSALTFKISLLE